MNHDDPKGGLTFDSHDPLTSRLGSCVSTFLRGLYKPRNWRINLYALMVFVLTIYSLMPPGAYLFASLIAKLGWFILGCLWGVRLIGYITGCFLRRPVSHAPSRYWKWAIVPLLYLMSLGLRAYEIPFRITLHLSMPAMERMAQEALLYPPNIYIDRKRWIGLYRTNSIYTFPGGFRFRVRGALGVLQFYGFAYSLHGEPVKVSLDDDHYCHLTGPWYLWIEDF